MAFEAEVTSRDGVAVVHLSGQLDSAAEAGMTAAHDQLIDQDASAVVLNFTDIGYINSSGIALIVQILARAKADGRPVRAVGLTDHYKHVFEITRLSDFMTLYETEGAAVKGTPKTADRTMSS